MYVDRDMWEKVILNLLSNAFKFTFEGGISVKVRRSGDGGAAEVAIADTGTGIPPEELPHLFERFHRVEGARGRSIEGSGIGLALVHELVKLHAGSIRVESRVGKGSTFTVAIPLGTAHLPPATIGTGKTKISTGVRAQAYVDEAMSWLSDEEPTSEVPPASSAAAVSVPRASGESEGRRVLVADDNADMRQYLERLLVGAGYRVAAVNDGEAALETARRTAPDLVISDVMMPRLDGFSLLAGIRGDDTIRDIPVVLLSARAGEESKVEGLRAAADDYLVKPFSARELLARVEANLKLAGARRESALLLREEAETLERLNEVGTAVAAEVDLDRAVQVVTDAATRLSGAAFGSFFFNATDGAGESYSLHAPSEAPREASSQFPLPRNAELLRPTFQGKAVVRSDDITRDKRHGGNPYGDIPAGHVPIRSYLAVPVIARSGEVLGGLFLGHLEPGVFNERAERIVNAIALQAAIAIDKARLYRAAQEEIERRRTVEAALRESEQSLERKVAERTAELAAANASSIAAAAEREKAEGNSACS